MNKSEEIKNNIEKWGGNFSTDRYVEDMVITPEIASYFLGTMEKNRKLKQNKLNQYEADIKSGRFKDCPALICFDTEGHMIDGQHRMVAVINTGVPVKLSLKFDYAPDTIFDNSAMRSPADIFYMSSLTDDDMASKNYISIINAIIACKFGDHVMQTMSVARKSDFANKYETELILASSIANKGVKHGICNKANVKAAFFAAIIYGIGSDVLSHFADCANNLRAKTNAETAATVFSRQVDKMTNYGRSARHVMTNITEEAIDWFCLGKKREQVFPGTHNIYFDKINLDF